MSRFPALELVDESPLRDLLPDSVKPPWEASGLALVNGRAMVVLDNDCRIACLSPTLEKDASNLWLGSKRGADLYRGFEGITWVDDAEHLLALVEAAPDPRNRRQFRALVVQLDAQCHPEEQTWLDPPFVSDNKGFEGLQWLPEVPGRSASLLALCEGNRCLGGAEGRKPGGGRIHIYQRRGRVWGPHQVLALPPWLPMTDYSDLSVRADGRIAVLSQESSLVWLGWLDLRTLQLDGAGRCYEFPRSKKGKLKYAYAEGVCWDGDELLVVSDQAKSDDPKRVRRRAESIHRFRIP